MGSRFNWKRISESGIRNCPSVALFILVTIDNFNFGRKCQSFLRRSPVGDFFFFFDVLFNFERVLHRKSIWIISLLRRWMIEILKLTNFWHRPCCQWSVENARWRSKTSEPSPCGTSEQKLIVCYNCFSEIPAVKLSNKFSKS